MFQYKIILEKIRDENQNLEKTITECNNSQTNFLVTKILAQLSTELINFYNHLDEFFNNCNLIRVHELFLQIKKSDESLYKFLVNNVKSLFSQFMLSTHTPYFELLYKVKLQKNILSNSFIFLRHIDNVN